MEYEVGSLADLISGTKTPNKKKVVQKAFKIKNDIEKEIVLEENKGESIEQVEKVKNAVKKLKKRKHQTPNSDIEDSTEKLEEVVTKKQKRRFVEGDDTNDEPNNSDESDDSADEKTRKPAEKLHNAVKRIKAKVTKEKHAERNEDDEPLFSDRTIFVGNVSIHSHKGKLKSFFKTYGTVESVRFRCAPVADPRTPKKVAIIKQEFHPDRNSLHAYVRFATKEEAQKALEANGKCFKEKHLRVTMSSDTHIHDEKKAIFIGNLSFDAEDDDLWTLFEACGDIESVRIIRDRRTSIGKGFAYVNFVSADSVELAMQMENVMFKNRELRISVSNAATAKSKKKVDKQLRRKENGGFKPRRSNMDSGDGQIRQKSFNIKDKGFQGSKFTEKKKKKFDKGAHQKKKMINRVAPHKSA